MSFDYDIINLMKLYFTVIQMKDIVATYNRKRRTRNFYSYFFHFVRSHAVNILKSRSIKRQICFVTFAILSAKHRRRTMLLSSNEKKKKNTTL